MLNNMLSRFRVKPLWVIITFALCVATALSQSTLLIMRKDGVVSEPGLLMIAVVFVSVYVLVYLKKSRLWTSGIPHLVVVAALYLFPVWGGINLFGILWVPLHAYSTLVMLGVIWAHFHEDREEQTNLLKQRERISKCETAGDLESEITIALALRNAQILGGALFLLVPTVFLSLGIKELIALL